MRKIGGWVRTKCICMCWGDVERGRLCIYIYTCLLHPVYSINTSPIPPPSRKHHKKANRNSSANVSNTPSNSIKTKKLLTAPPPPHYKA